MSDSAKPKPLFFIVVGLVIAGLLLYAFRGTIFPEGGADSTDPAPIAATPIDPADLPAAAPATVAQGDSVEALDSNAPTTVKEYNYVAQEKLPPVKAKSDYKPLQARTVKFALNVWAGWAPIILQNMVGDAEIEWTTPDGGPFKV